MVRPIALREDGFFEQGRKQFLPYLIQDAPREAKRLGIQLIMPNPDPIMHDVVTGKVAADQPYMDKIMPYGLAANVLGKGFEFSAAMGRKIWSGVVNWHEDENIQKAAIEAELDYDDLKAVVVDQEDRLRSDLERNEAQQTKHHWGVPLMVFDGEPFFGQDRIASLVWRLQQNGLKS